MKSEQQYIDLYGEAADIIKSKSCPVMNALRDTAFETFRSQGFPHARWRGIAIPTWKRPSRPTTACRSHH